MGTQVMGREKAWAGVASESFLRVGLYKVREGECKQNKHNSWHGQKAFSRLTVWLSGKEHEWHVCCLSSILIKNQ